MANPGNDGIVVERNPEMVEGMEVFCTQHEMVGATIPSGGSGYHLAWAKFSMDVEI
jgi:hypothetical protein